MLPVHLCHVMMWNIRLMQFVNNTDNLFGATGILCYNYLVTYFIRI